MAVCGIMWYRDIWEPACTTFFPGWGRLRYFMHASCGSPEPYPQFNARLIACHSLTLLVAACSCSALSSITNLALHNDHTCKLNYGQGLSGRWLWRWWWWRRWIRRSSSSAFWKKSVNHQAYYVSGPPAEAHIMHNNDVH